MKIVIKRERKVVLYFPLSFIKSKLFLKLVDLNEEEIRYDEIIRSSYNELKKFIKKNEHFVLVNVTTKEGVKVKIVV